MLADRFYSDATNLDLAILGGRGMAPLGHVRRCPLQSRSEVSPLRK